MAALEPNRATGYHVIRVLLQTGARKNEILGLRRDRTDLDRKMAQVKAKGYGDKGRTILLSDKAVEILRSLPTIGR